MFKSILVPIDLADTDLAKPAIATAATERQARKLMIATSVSRLRRATVRGGTIGLATRGGVGRPSAVTEI